MPALDEQSVELLGQIMTANATYSEQITSQVFDNYEREVREWKLRFAALFDAVDRAGEVLTTRQLEAVLARNAYWAETARGSAMSDAH